MIKWIIIGIVATALIVIMLIVLTVDIFMKNFPEYGWIMIKWIIIGIVVTAFIVIMFIGVDALKCTAPCI